MEQAEQGEVNSATAAAVEGATDAIPAEKASTDDAKVVESETQGRDASQYKWCKCYFDAPPGTQDFYFMHFDSHEQSYEEPDEPYWVWDASTQTVHPSGLQTPSSKKYANLKASSGLDPEYQGYNPKIHGNYDPNAPYARYHDQNHADETPTGSIDPVSASLTPGDAAYASAGTFNRFTGSFQPGDKTTERHNDFNKSGRQLNAFFDVDTAANVHDGRSLKEERRSQKLSKKEIQELSKKRREKKDKKRMEFYKS